MENKENKKDVKVIITECAFILITILGYVFSTHIFGWNSVFNNAITNNDFINSVYAKIPAVIKTIQIITITVALYKLFSLLTTRFLKNSNRGITIVKLCNSFMKYVIIIISIMCILSAWGVDTKTLFASAGILSLIIGLGAQSLISDIIAGVFIVFESEFKVGDIVIIDGWRGTVDEIGIRTTKVIDWQGNIKIINNSNISSIINQSKELSVTTCVIGIDYKESIPKVELLIKNNMDRLRQAIPQIVDGPYYKGVDSLAESSVNLLFIATVKESDYYVVQRALNRELKIIFDENNISIPFPQVTINTPDNFDKKTTESEKINANLFASEQMEISKNLEKTNK